LLPELDGRLVRNQSAVRRVFYKHSAEGRIYPEITEGISAGKMHEIRYLTENLALGSFACTRCPKEENGSIFHRNNFDFRRFCCGV
jgi:hypothetical protein